MFLLASSCVACQENFIHKYCAVDCQAWQPDYKARFKVDEITEEGIYALDAEVRIDKKYAYKELWIVLDTKISSSSCADTTYVDTVMFKLVGKDGEMTGDGRNLLEYKKKVRKLHIVPSDSLNISIHHIMSDKRLAGVHDVGFSLKR